MPFPFLPGVPPLLNPYVAGAVTLASGAILNVLNTFRLKWGIYDAAGNLAINPDSFVGIEYVNSSRISSYPVEKGAFASYNKVQNPRSYSIVMSKGGTQASMDNFLSILENLEETTDLYTIVTPNRSYSNTNVDRTEYRREIRNGAGMIIAIIHFTEIRQASEAFSTSNNSLVPASAITNSTTGLGLPSATATVPSCQASINGGVLYPITTALTPAGTIS